MMTNIQAIPGLNLQKQYLAIKPEIDAAISNVIKDSAFIGGKYVSDFEQELSKYCGVASAVSLNSGTDALFLTLEAMGIKEGDEVITTPFTFFATAECISRLRATPVFVDIDPQTFNLDIRLIKESLTKRTKAIIPVHLFGMPASMKEVNRIADAYSLKVIEDACQAIGATYFGKKAGSLGHSGCFSFFPSKNLGAYGDGGAVVTNDLELADKIKVLRNHGSKIKYQNEQIGVNSRLDGLQAAILSVKLKYLDGWNNTRRDLANTYNNLLKEVSQVTPPSYNSEDAMVLPVYHQYTIRVKNGKRDQLKDYLATNNINTAIYYPSPLHQLTAMSYLGYKKGDFPESEQASQEVLSLPMYPELTIEEITYITNHIKRFFV